MREWLPWIMSLVLALLLVVSVHTTKTYRQQYQDSLVRIAWCEEELRRYCGDWGG